METFSSCDIAYRVATDGWDLPFSIWETNDGDTPSCRATSRSDSPASSRTLRSLAPRFAGASWVGAAGALVVAPPAVLSWAAT
jgi:hypothetical protein